MKLTSTCRALLSASALSLVSLLPLRATGAGGTSAIKDYLVGQVTKMDAAAHDYVVNAQAYDRIIQANHGDYN